MKMEPLQNGHVRELNRLSVYRILQSNRKLSRADIARATLLSAPTVASIVQGFVAAGLAAEVGQAYSAGGRPAQLVRFVSDARHVLSLDLSGNHARGAAIDLLGAVQGSFDGPKLAPGSENALFTWLGEVLSRHSRTGTNIARVAVAVPGVVAPRSGHVRLAPALGWDDYPLAEKLHRETGLEAVLENDVNALAIAELHYGSGRHHRHVLYVAIGSGIGAGLVIDGRLYRGADSAAGEIGYSILPHVAVPAKINLGIPGPLEQHLLELIPAFSDSAGHLQLEGAASRQAFETFADDLGLILHNLTCLLNPELVVIAWPIGAERLIARLQAGWRSPLSLKIAPAALGQDAALRGVARLALDGLEQELCASRAPAGGEHALAYGL
jgi:predicted NBD/HSP70 family sugar kinase